MNFDTKKTNILLIVLLLLLGSSVSKESLGEIKVEFEFVGGKDAIIGKFNDYFDMVEPNYDELDTDIDFNYEEDIDFDFNEDYDGEYEDYVDNDDYDQVENFDGEYDEDFNSDDFFAHLEDLDDKLLLEAENDLLNFNEDEVEGLINQYSDNMVYEGEEYYQEDALYYLEAEEELFFLATQKSITKNEEELVNDKFKDFATKLCLLTAVSKETVIYINQSVKV